MKHNEYIGENTRLNSKHARIFWTLFLSMFDRCLHCQIKKRAYMLTGNKNTKNPPALHNTEGGLALRSRADKFFLRTKIISSIISAV